MRVLMISDVYFPRINGVSSAISTYRRTLLAEGIEVRLIAPDYGKPNEDEDWIVRVPGRPVPRDPEDRIMRWKPLLAAIEREASHADLIHVQTPFLAHYAAVKVAKKLGLPLVSTYHTLFEEYFQHYLPFLPASWLKLLARRISQKQCDQMDKIIVPSRAIHQRLSEYGVSRPLEILPTGIPLSQFNSGNGVKFREDYGIHPERPIALFVGRVAHEKNIGFLIESLAHAREHIPDILLLITGEGPAQVHLQRDVDKYNLGENVKFLGYLDRTHELPHCYAAANAFVFASRTETQGLVLLEAMAMGLPVIALSSMGTTDILEAERGAITPLDDPLDFSRALIRLFSDPDLQRKLSDEAKVHAREWDETKIAKQLAQTYY